MPNDIQYYPNIASACEAWQQLPPANPLLRVDLIEVMTTALPTQLPPFRGNFYIVALLLNGYTACQTNETVYGPDGPCLRFSPPLLAQSRVQVDPQARGYNILVAPDFWLPDAAGWPALPFVQGEPHFSLPLSAEQVAEVLPLFAALHAQQDRPLAHQEVLRSYLRTILLLALACKRQYDVPNQDGQAAVVTQLFDKLLEDAFRRASIGHAPVARHLTAAYCAQQLGVHPKYLAQVVRQVKQTTPSQLLRARLALEARTLLSVTDLDVAEIAGRLGFADTSNFAKFFRGQLGVSPSQYRQTKKARAVG